MKKILFIFITAIAVISLSCEKESEFTNNPPQIEILTPTVSGSPEETVTISANLTDDYVLKFANIICTPLAINDRVYISLKHTAVNASQDVIKSSENFSYDFTIPAFATPGDYQIRLEVKNVTGQVSTANIVLTVS